MRIAQTDIMPATRRSQLGGGEVEVGVILRQDFGRTEHDCRGGEDVLARRDSVRRLCS